MNKFGLLGKLKALNGILDELASILLEASELIAQVSGCILYIVSKDMKEHDYVWITEVWNTKAEHDDSLKIPAVRTLISKAIPIIDGSPEKGQELVVLGGHGIS